MKLKHVQRLISERINELASDERLSCPTATVVENAPLALIQLALENRVDELRKLQQDIQSFSNEVIK